MKHEDKPSFNGKTGNQGRIVIGEPYPNEGYAILKCGNTELQIGATLLYHLRFKIDKDSPRAAELSELSREFNHILSEAFQGHTG